MSKCRSPDLMISSANKFSRAKVRAFRREHGQAWLGNVNLYDHTPPNFTQYESGMVRNFSFHFAIPAPDDKLKALILERDAAPYTGTRADAPMVDAIFNRIEALGGIVLNWV